MPIKDEEDKLFREWKNTEGRDPRFVPDGVVEEDAYLASHPKLMFVLKEVNDPEFSTQWDLRKFLREGGRGMTWNNVAGCVAAIRALPEDLPSGAYKNDEAFRKANLRSIVAMNLKKLPGGATTDPTKLRILANEDRPFIRRQVELYKPHFIICCGLGVADLLIEALVEDSLRGKVKLELENNGSIEWAPSKLIRAPHPARMKRGTFVADIVGKIRRLTA